MPDIVVQVVSLAQPTTYLHQHASHHSSCKQFAPLPALCHLLSYVQEIDFIDGSCSTRGCLGQRSVALMLNALLER